MRSHATLEELCALAREYAAARWPNAPAVKLCLKLSDGRLIASPLPDALPSVAAAVPPAPTRHSPDFRSVHWHGADYTFTPNQAAAVKLLWEAHHNGTPEVSGELLLEAADSEARRVCDLFRDNPAWGAFIGTTRRGLYRLNAPSGP
jgi:hypothetical protein